MVTNKKKIKSSKTFKTSKYSNNKKSNSQTWLRKRGSSIFTFLNIFFIFCGIGLIITAMINSSGIYARMYESGTGYNLGGVLGGFGAIVIVTAMMGEMGARKDIKCFLSLYFILSFLAMIGLIIMSSFFLSEDIDETMSKWWDKFDTDLKSDIQNKYGCCGFEDSSDRSVDGCGADDITDIPEGCKSVADDNLKEKLVPLLLFSIILGILLLLGQLLAAYLMCRPTGRRTKGTNSNVSGIIGWNKFENDETDIQTSQGSGLLLKNTNNDYDEEKNKNKNKNEEPSEPSDIEDIL